VPELDLTKIEQAPSACHVIVAAAGLNIDRQHGIGKVKSTVASAELLLEFLNEYAFPVFQRSPHSGSTEIATTRRMGSRTPPSEVCCSNMAKTSYSGTCRVHPDVRRFASAAQRRLGHHGYEVI
jgi:hypothetical protein